jgi:hypothetical protein
MGLKLFSSCACDTPKAEVSPGRDFNILRTKTVGRCLVVEVHYPKATNYEGRKVMVFRDVSDKALRIFKLIDPHFCEKGHTSPLARFAPTTEGWHHAVAFAILIGEAA